MAIVDTGHIAIDPTILGGKPHIAGHRIAVTHVAVWIVYQGSTPQEIADEFGLTLGEIHAALAYYFDHRQEIDRSIEETAHQADDLAQRYPHGWNPALGPLHTA